MLAPVAGAQINYVTRGEGPVCLVLSSIGTTVPHGLWDDVLPRLPDATLRLFERSGHQPFVEEPERFTGELTNWLAGHTPDGGSASR